MPQTTVTDLTGRIFGKLTVLQRAPNPPGANRAHWLCRCTCGAEAIKNGKYLLCGHTTSCGCEQRAMRARGHVKHGGIVGGVKQREYTIWRGMKSRCYTKSASNYEFYGGRGITVCDRWRDDYLAFLADMGSCPPDYSIDRIDPRGNYEPSNCRWASGDAQHNNTGRNVFVTFEGERLTLSQIAKRADVTYAVLWKRVQAGESVEQVIQHFKQLRVSPVTGRRLRALASYSRRSPAVR